MEYRSDLMKSIQTDRYPTSRVDSRTYDTTTFWGTTQNSILINYKHTQINNIVLNLSETNITSKFSNHNNFKIRQNNKHMITIHLHKEIINRTHNIENNKIKHAIYTDNLNNTYIICLNENTSDYNYITKILHNLEKTTKSLKLQKKAYLRAIFLSEIFICLSSQLWHLPNLKPSHLLEKIIDITALSAYFIMKAGLLCDPIFLTMTGHLGKDKRTFYRIPESSRMFNLENQNLYYDTYFNKNNSKQNFISKNYSDKFHKKITLYFNDSCIIDPQIQKIEWTKNIYRDHYSLNNKTYIGRSMLSYTFYNYAFFIIKAPELVQFQNAVIPNEMGRIYITHYNITPQTLTSNILIHTASITKNTAHKSKSKELKNICKKLLYFKITGLTR